MNNIHNFRCQCYLFYNYPTFLYLLRFITYNTIYCLYGGKKQSNEDGKRELVSQGT